MNETERKLREAMIYALAALQVEQPAQYTGWSQINIAINLLYTALAPDREVVS